MAGVLCALLCGFWLGEEQTQLADRVIRFHVIANSDSPEDQALKLQVRDAVLSATEEFYPQKASLEEARAALYRQQARQLEGEQPTRPSQAPPKTHGEEETHGDSTETDQNPS